MTTQGSSVPRLTPLSQQRERFFLPVHLLAIETMPIPKQNVK